MIVGADDDDESTTASSCVPIGEGSRRYVVGCTVVVARLPLLPLRRPTATTQLDSWPADAGLAGARKHLQVSDSNCSACSFVAVASFHLAFGCTDDCYYTAPCRCCRRYSASRRRESDREAPNPSCRRTMRLLAPVLRLLNSCLRFCCKFLLYCFTIVWA